MKNACAKALAALAAASAVFVFGCTMSDSPEAPKAPVEKVVSFDDVPFEIGKEYFIGSSGTAAFTSNGVSFPTYYYYDTQYQYESWKIAVSSKTDTATAGFLNQFSVYTGAAKSGGKFVVVSCFSPVEVPLPSKVTVMGFYLTNTTYAALSMKNGDQFATPFSEGSWFKLVVKGYDESNALKGTREFYLADYRSDVPAERYILDQWRYFDLSSLGEVAKITAVVDSSDTGPYGINTPAYFAMDDLILKGPF